MTEEFKLKSNYFYYHRPDEYGTIIYKIEVNGADKFRVSWDTPCGNPKALYYSLANVITNFREYYWIWCDKDGNPISEDPSVYEKQDDAVKNPKHYQLLEGVEVKDVNKALLDKMEATGYDITLFEAGWYQQAMQYFMRFYAKNGINDLEKGVETMQFVINSMKERQNG